MNVDILSILTLVGSIITLVSAIWKVAEAKAELQRTITIADTKLEKKISDLTSYLEDEIKDLESRLDLYNKLKESEDKNWKEGMRERYRIVRHDLYDVQRFLQSDHGFKIRLNSGTLNERPSQD